METVFKSPGPYPNGLQATGEGLWIIDGEDARAHLVSYRDGTVLRGFDTEAVHPSGITFDGTAIWIASTYSRELIRADASSGKTLAKHFTPGAGVIYRMPSDPPGRRSPLAPPPEPAGATPAPAQPRPGNRRSRPGVAGRQAVGGGAAVPNDLPHRPRKLDRRAALPHHRQPPPRHRLGRRPPSGCTDTNLNAFFRHDPTSGEILQKIQLADEDPLPHGMSIRDGVLWYCDDVGIVCRLKL